MGAILILLALPAAVALIVGVVEDDWRGVGRGFLGGIVLEGALILFVVMVLAGASLLTRR